MDQPDIHEGGCLCGAIRYRVTAAPTALVVCHCRSCRKASGAPSLAWAIFQAADFGFTSGKPATFASSSGVERGFCARCGTTLTYAGADRPDVADVTTATLDNPDAFAPTKEIWLEEKIGWEAVDHARLRYPRSSRSSEPLP
ncbi:MAG TPA: GFA family protein [Rudaea sp.]|jgi:hypothetical protein